MQKAGPRRVLLISEVIDSQELNVTNSSVASEPSKAAGIQRISASTDRDLDRLSII